MKSTYEVQESARGLAYIAQIEQTFQLKLEEGRNPDVEFMAHLWEPLRWLHKPLAVYMLAECMGLTTSCLLHALGFRPFRHHNVSKPHHVHSHLIYSAQLGSQCLLLMHHTGKHD